MRVASSALPFTRTFRRLELERYWWHRLCVVLFLAALLGTVVLIAAISYTVLAPQLATIPEINAGDWAVASTAPQSGIDYNALARQYGGTTSPPPPSATQPNSIDLSHGLVPKQPAQKTIEMPDGSTATFAGTVSNDAIVAQWYHAKIVSEVRAALYAGLIALIIALIFSYVMQLSYRALLYVLFGKAVYE